MSASPVPSPAADPFRAVFDANPFPSWIYDPRTLRILEVNAAAVRQYGYTREEFLRLTVADLRPPEDVGALLRQLATRPEGLCAWEDTWRHRRKDGTLLDVRVTSNPVDFDGRAARLVVVEDLTAQRREAGALWESHALLQAVIDGSTDAVFAKDRDGRYLLINRAGAERIGRPPAEIVGRTDFELFTAPLAERIAAGDRRVLESGVTETVEEVHPEGGPRVHLTTRAVYRNSRGEILGIVGVTRDVTAERAMEAELRASEARFRTLAEDAPLGIALVRDGRVLYGNPAARRIFGFTPDTPLGMPFLDCIAPEDRDAVIDRMRRRAGGEQIGKVEVRGIRPDGTVFPYEVSTAMLDLADGPAMVAFIADITERKRQEEALRSSEALLSEVLETLPVGVWILDTEGRIIYGNSAGRAIWGGSHFAGLDCFAKLRARRAHGGELLRADEWAGARAVRHGETTMGELLEIEALDGSVRTIVNSAVPLRDPSGGIRGALIVNEDITDRRRAQEELLASQEQLRQSQKMEAVGRLAGGVAHDFNNLLTAILSYSELLLADLPPGDPAREDVAQIRQAGQRAADLTRQLLAFSRQQVLKPRPISLNAVVAEMDKMLRRVIGEDVELRIALAPEVGTVLADPGQMEQVLLNLAVNARDAMPDGGTLLIATEDAEVDDGAAARLVHLAPGPYVRLVVQDTGIGMDPTTQTRIFEPFFTTKERGKGTGLGLSTVYGIVKQSGGSIFVDSEPGRGATFTIYLPRVDAEPEDIASSRPREPVPGHAETILLVEDDALVRNLARSILHRAGYEVLEAADAPAALELCERHPGPIHLVVTDVVMPKMSGRELIERLPPSRAGVPVLFVSGYSEEAIQGRGTLVPDAELLPKPFTPGALTAKVRELLLRSRGAP